MIDLSHIIAETEARKNAHGDTVFVAVLYVENVAVYQSESSRQLATVLQWAEVAQAVARNLAARGFVTAGLSDLPDPAIEESQS